MENEQQIIETQVPLTWEQFYEQCKPEGIIMQYWQVNKIYDSIRKNRLTFRQMNLKYGRINHKKYGECDCGVLYYYEWLNYLNAVSNINKPLPPVTVKQLAFILYTKYFYFYIADLKLILEWILEGRYGVFYGSVDSQLIMRAFREYSEERRKLMKQFFPERVI